MLQLHHDGNMELLEQSSLNSSLLSNSSLSLPEKSAKKQVKFLAIQTMEGRAEVQQSPQLTKVIQSLNEFQVQNKRKCINVYQLDWEYRLPVILPTSTLYLIWKVFIASATLFIFFEVPVYVMYGPQFWNELMPKQQVDSLFYGIAILMIFDIGLDFITAYYKHGNLITCSHKIARHYAVGYFPFDSIALICAISRLAADTTKLRWIYFVFYLKYFSLLKIDTFLSQLVLLHRRLRTGYQVAKILISMFFYFNFFCCVFYAIGTWALASGIQNSWLNNDGNFGVIQQLPLHQQYFFSFYYSLGTVSTTMGYGDVTPMNIYECSWALLGIIFAVIVFALNISNFQTLMEEYNATNLRIFKHQVCINKFMEVKKVPPELRERIRQYLNEYWYETGTRETIMEQQIFLQLAPELKSELMYYSYGAFLQKSIYVKQFSQPFLIELSSMIKEISYSAGEVIIKNQANEQQDEFSLFYLVRGHVIVRPGNNIVLAQRIDEGIFGEWSFFTGFPRTAAVEAKVYCELHKIRKEDFLFVAERFPNDYEAYCMIRDELKFQSNFSIIGKKCFSCNESTHLAVNCNLTHYQPNALSILDESSIVYIEQQRLQIDRILRKQWPARMNADKLIKGLNKSKLQRKATMMLKTQRTKMQVTSTSPTKSIEVENPMMESIIRNPSQSEQKSKLEEYKKISIYIRESVTGFDQAANYKFYYPSQNSSNWREFLQLEAGQRRFTKYN